MSSPTSVKVSSSTSPEDDDGGDDDDGDEGDHEAVLDGSGALFAASRSAGELADARLHDQSTDEALSAPLLD